MGEDNILRLENAMATLAEISAQHNERLAAVEHSTQRLENTFHALTELVASQTERVNGVERSMQTLIELAADHQQLIANMQRRVTGLEESHVMLVGMLRNQHDGMTELRAAQADASAKIAALAVAQAHSDRRLDALIDIVRGGRKGPSES